MPAAAHADTTLEEVRVTAQRNLLGQPLRASDATHSITADAQVSLNRTVGDWLARLPGVSLNGQGGLLQSYSLRGFSRWRIRTEIDGIPIITDRPAGNAASFLPPSLLASTTASLGPASSLYGSGAMGGVVSLQTLTLDGQLLDASAQSNDAGISTTIGRGRSDRGSAAVSVRRADNAEDARGNPLNTGYEQLGLALHRRVQGDAWEATLSWLPSHGRDIGKSNSDYPDTLVSDYPEETHSLLNLRLAWDAGWYAQLYHHHQDWQSRVEQIAVGSNVIDYRSDTVGGLVYAASDWAGNPGRIGAEWVGRRNVDIRDAELSAEGEIINRSQTIDGGADNLAVFMDQQWQRGPLTLSGGLRYDWTEQRDRDRSRSNARLNGNLGLSWQASTAWRLGLDAGTGFRFPALTELYFNGVTPRGDTLGNPDLEPEKNRSVQLSAAYREGALGFTAAAYHNALKDYIERYRVSPTLRSYRNLDSAAIWGLEVSLDWEQHRNLSHSLGFEWQRGQDDSGRWLADLNPPGLRWLLDWQRDAWRLTSDLSYRFSREEFGEDEQPLDAVWIWGARASRALGRHWRGSVFVDNVFDSHYLGSADDQAPFQPGRTVGVALSWERDAS